MARQDDVDALFGDILGARKPAPAQDAPAASLDDDIQSLYGDAFAVPQRAPLPPPRGYDVGEEQGPPAPPMANGIPLPPPRPAPPLPPERPTAFNPADTRGLSLDEPGPFRSGGTAGDAAIGATTGMLSAADSDKARTDAIAAAEEGVRQAYARRDEIKAARELQTRAPTNSVQGALESLDRRLAPSAGVAAQDPAIVEANEAVRQAEAALNTARSAPPPTQSWLRQKAEKVVPALGAAVSGTLEGRNIVADALPDMPGKIGELQRALRTGRDAAGAALQQDLAQKFAPDPTRAQELGTKVIDGLASTAVMAAGGVAGGLAKAPAMFTMSMTAGLPQAAQLYREAERAAPDSTWKKWAAFAGGMGMGPMEAIPVGRLFDRLERLSGGGVTRWVGSTVAQVGEEGLQESASALVQNLIAKGLYDPHRGLADGVPDAALVGALSGGVFAGVVGAAAMAARPGQDRGIPTPEAIDQGTINRAVLQELSLQPPPQNIGAPPPGVTHAGPARPLPLPPAPGHGPAQAPVSPAPAEAAATAAAVPGPARGAMPDAGGNRAPVPAGSDDLRGDVVGPVPGELGPAPLDPQVEAATRILLGAGYAPEQIEDLQANPEELALEVEAALAAGVTPYEGPLPDMEGPAPFENGSGPNVQYPVESPSEPTSDLQQGQGAAVTPSATAPGVTPESTPGSTQAPEPSIAPARPVENQGITPAPAPARDPFDSAFDDGQDQADAAQAQTAAPVTRQNSSESAPILSRDDVTPPAGQDSIVGPKDDGWRRLTIDPVANAREAKERRARNAARRKKPGAIQTPGTNVYWSDIPEWLDAGSDIARRPISGARHTAEENHIKALDQNLPVIRNANQEQLEQLVTTLKKRKGRKDAPKAYQLATDRLAQFRNGTADKAKQPRQDKRQPRTLIEHLMQIGGLAPSAELNARDLHKAYRPGWGSLVRKKGHHLDKAREHATELGYLQPHQTIDDLLELLVDEYHRKNKALTAAEQTYAPEEEQDPAEREFEIRSTILQFLHNDGLPPGMVNEADVRLATDLVMQGEVGVEDAYHAATLLNAEKEPDFAPGYDSGDIPFLDYDRTPTGKDPFDDDTPDTQAASDDGRAAPAHREDDATSRQDTGEQKAGGRDDGDRASEGEPEPRSERAGAERAGAETVPGEENAVERLRAADEAVDRAAEAKSDDFFDLAGERHEAQKAAAKELAAAGDKRVVLVHPTSGHKAVITRNTDDEGPWRITYFDKDGPYGHRVFESQEAAIADALKESYRPAPKTEKTHDGVAGQTVIPGAEKIGDKEQAQRKADQGLKAKAPQKDTDGLALFGDSHKQGDLMDALSAPAKAERPQSELRDELQGILDEAKKLDTKRAKAFVDGASGRLNAPKPIALNEGDLDFYRKRLKELQDEATAKPERVLENITLLDRLDANDQRAVEQILDAGKEEDRQLIMTAFRRFVETVAFINQGGYKVENVNTGTERQDLYNAKGYLGSLSGAVVRLARSVGQHGRGDITDERMASERDALRGLNEYGKTADYSQSAIAFENEQRTGPVTPMANNGRVKKDKPEQKDAFDAAFDEGQDQADQAKAPKDDSPLGPMMQRIDNAHKKLVESLAHFGKIDTASAEKVAAFYKKHKLVKLDAGIGTYNVKHGGLLAKDAIRRALEEAEKAPAKKTRTKTDVAKSAAKNTVEGANAAIKAAGELFKNKNRLGSGPTWDDETWAAAKPLFIQAAQKFRDAWSDLNELVRRMVMEIRASAGLNREEMENLRLYMRRFVDDVRDGTITLDQETDGAPGSSDSVEPDRGDAGPRDGLGAADVPAAGGSARRGAGRGGRSGRSGGARVARGRAGVPQSDAAAVGEEGDRDVRGGAPAVSSGAAERRDGAGSGTDREPGLQPDDGRAGSLEPAASDSPDVKERQRRQDAAETIPVEPGIANITKTLPFLFPAQQEDVWKAEKRFETHHGMLFTNGTGTGKTFSGLGIIKRLVKQGKSDILVVAPSQDILNDWVSRGKMLGLDIKILEDTNDKGTGLVATTYANLGANNNLAKRKWDLIVTDESHKLASAQDGKPSLALDNLRGLTHHPRYLRNKVDMLLPEIVTEMRAIQKIASDRRSRAQELRLRSLQHEYNEKAPPILAQLRTEPRSKVVMLSATPFAYVEALDYAEGYLFDYPPDPQSSAYNTPSGKGQFFITNFGYRMRYGRLTKPEAEVNSEVMERQFHEKLKRDGSLSGRMLDVSADYERHFAVVDDAVGRRIDQALDWLSEQGRKFDEIHKQVTDQFDYLSRMRLLEAIKANHAIPLIRQDLALGRKVVVFHDYNQGAGFDPFDFSWVEERPNTPYIWYEPNPNRFGDRIKHESTWGAVLQEFHAANPFVKDLSFSQFRNPIETLSAAFPNALIYNGTIPQRQRTEAKRLFNEDGSGRDLIVIQAAAGEAGISLHDTTGKQQRALYNLGMPVRPTTAIQEEGRIYREGQVTDAIFRYFNTGTNWERWAFANRIAERASTAENLALGEQARTLKQSFIDAFTDATEITPSAGEGKGGKAKDRREGAGISRFEKAKTFYWGRQKTRGRRDQREGVDYYATPEPLGLKMVEWAGINANERVLEPSAGHGAIARFFPEGSNRTLIEPSSGLLSQAALNSVGARVIQGTFEDHHITNKYDAIVMNPPFGVGGKTAVEHVAKAWKHLRNGGRLVAIIPDGQGWERFNTWADSTDPGKGLVIVEKIKLPGVAFERAGTSVRSFVVVLEKQTDDANIMKWGDRLGGRQGRIDLSGAEDITAFFNRIENLDLPPRLEPVTPEAEPLPDTGEVQVGGHTFQLEKGAEDSYNLVGKKSKLPWDEWKKIAPSARRAGAAIWWKARTFTFKTPEARAAFVAQGITAPPAEEAAAEQAGTTTEPIALPAVEFKLGQTKHSKTGADLFVATFRAAVPRETYDRANHAARAAGGHYSSFRGSGAIPGFQFPTEAARQTFLDQFNGPAVQARLGPSAGVLAADKALGQGPETLHERIDLSGYAIEMHTSVPPQVRAKIRREVKALVEQLAPVETRQAVVDRIKVPGEGFQEAYGYSGLEGVEHDAHGLYHTIDDIVVVATAGWNHIATAIHEIWHSVQRHGLMTKQEAAILKRERKSLEPMVVAMLNGEMRKQGGPFDAYTAKEVAGYKQAEIEAFSVEAMALGYTPEGVHIGARRFLARMAQIYRRVRNLVAGYGYQNSEDIYEAFFKGDMRRRSQPAPDYAAMSPELRKRLEQLHKSKTQASFSRRTIDDIARRNAAAGLPALPAPNPPSFPTPQERVIGRGRLSLNVDNVRANFQDEFGYLERVQDAITAVRGPIPDVRDAKLGMKLMSGKRNTALKDFDRQHVEPLKKAIAAERLTAEEVGVYLIARHAQARNDYAAQINAKKFANDGGSGMATSVAQDLINEFAAAGKQAGLERIAQRVYAIAKFDRDNRVAAGLMSKAQRQAWEAMFPDGTYVPLRGFAEDNEDFGLGTGMGIDLRGRESKHALGRGSLSDNPLHAVLMMAQSGLVRAEKNQAAKALLRLVQAHPNKELWEIIKRPQGKFPTREYLNTKTGQVETMQDIWAPNDKDVIGVKVGGNQYFIKLHNKDLAEAYKNMGTADLNKFLQMIGSFTRLFSRMQTSLNPDFFFPNFGRDIQEASTTLMVRDAKLVKPFLLNVKRRGLWKAVAKYSFGRPVDPQWDRYIQRWRKAGGEISMYDFKDLKSIQKDMERSIDELGATGLDKAKRLPLKFGRGFFKVLDNTSSVLENQTRLAVFITAVENGYTDARAAALARDATIDFATRGKQSAWMNALWGFFNVGVQGAHKNVTQLIRSRKMQVAWGAMIGLGALQATLGHLAFGDDDEDPEGKRPYDFIPEHERRANFIIPYGTYKDERGNRRLSYFKFPLMFGFKIPYYLGEQAAMVVMGAQTPGKAVAGVLMNTLDAFNPLGQGSLLTIVSPTFLDPITELTANRNWLGHNIYPEVELWNEGIPNSSQPTNNATSPIAKGVADIANRIGGGDRYTKSFEVLGVHPLDWYPGAVEYVGGWLMGGTGRFFNNSIQSGISAVQGVPLELEKLPVFRRFLGQTDHRGEAGVYYEARKEAVASKNVYRLAKKAAGNDPTDADAVRALEREADKLRVTTNLGKDANWKGATTAPLDKADKIIKDLREEKLALPKSGVTVLEQHRRAKEIDAEIWQTQREARGAYRARSAP